MITLPLLILDIDGTVREGKDDALGRFVNGPEDVRVFPEAKAAMAEFKIRTGGRIIGVSNQGGIALGHITRVQAATAMRVTNEQAGGLFDWMGWCDHHPDAPKPSERHCWCRKPRPGLVYDALHQLRCILAGETYPPTETRVVGDRPEDLALAKALDVRFIHAKAWRTNGLGL